MFGMKSVHELAVLAAAGGGFDIPAGATSVDDLTMIAAAASRGNARITITGVGRLSQDDLIQIAAAGKGAIVFGK